MHALNASTRMSLAFAGVLSCVYVLDSKWVLLAINESVPAPPYVEKYTCIYFTYMYVSLMPVIFNLSVLHVGILVRLTSVHQKK